MRRKHGGRHARVRGRPKVDADSNLLAAAVNIARLGVSGGLQSSRSLVLSCSHTITPAPRLRLQLESGPNATPYGRLLGGRSCV